jgi:spermidine/putrescine transport system ATP-binding protein
VDSSVAPWSPPGQSAGDHGGSDVVVSFTQVAKRYKGAATNALEGIDLSVRGGEFFSLLGPSGSGKTTCLRLIAGFEQPDTGVIALDGTSMVGVPAYRRDINTVFQNYALFPHMTVAENVAYPLRMRRIDKSQIAPRVAEALDLVNMAGFEERLPQQLSGGQRQRVALARALVGRPRVLLLDEPLGALDLQLRQQMQTVLKQLQREVGITFIYVTHDQGEALSMSDRLAVMSAGRIEQVGTPRDIYYAPATPFVAGFIGKANIAPGEVVRSDAGVVGQWGSLTFPVPNSTPVGPCYFSLRPEATRLGSDAGEIRAEGVITDIIFLGDSSEVVVSASGLDLIAKVPAHVGFQCRVGQAATVSFSAADVVRVNG